MILAVLRTRSVSLALGALVLVVGLVAYVPRTARAYPGSSNVNSSVTAAGYISTAIVGLNGNCGGCHFGTTNPPTGLSLNGSGLGTFPARNDQVASFSLTYDIGDPSRQYGGFLIAHNDGTSGDNGGTLGAGGDGYEHACGPNDGFPCYGTSNTNTEIMHEMPRPASNGVVTFPFTYKPVAGTCGTFGFNLWVNNVNGDSMCNDTLDVPTETTFSIDVTCPPSTDPCQTNTCNTSTGTCVTNFLTGGTCNDGQSCTFNDTCTNGTCGGTTITCTSDSCNQRVCNGTAACTVTELTGACDDGQSCTVNDSCVSGTCVGTPTMSCPTQRPNGSSCSGAAQCASNHCVDGVCCNQACAGQCQACNLPPTNGTCSPVQGQPVSPRSACSGDGTACNGTCDGSTTATCVYPPTTQLCRSPSCANDTATLAANCDGNGNCPASPTQSCAPFVCGPTQCDGTCTVNAQCNPGLYCSVGKCVPLVGQGGACKADRQCTSGFCADGVCCDAQCSGQCEACNLSGNIGTCSPVVNAPPQKPRPDCASDGSPCGGTCDGTNRDECVYPGPAVQCRKAGCVNGVATVGATCEGTGSCPKEEQVTCGSACVGTECGNECVSAQQCNQGQFCQAGRCAPQFQNGDPCVNAGECQSSFCVDGVCCDSACDGQCEACDVAANPGSCTPVSGVPHGTRPACVGAGQGCGGKCDGKNAAVCAYPAEAKVCGAGKCVGDVATLPRVCTGEGTCGPVQVQLCSPFSCGATSCTGNCTADTDCPAGDYCSAGICRLENPLGAPCAAPNQCSSGFCVDGLCCNEACGAECEACDDPHSTGECIPISGAPHGARLPCGGSGVCGGTCDGKSAATCHFPDNATPCGIAACVGGVAVGSPTCNGVGNCIANAAPTDCYPLGCDPNGNTCAQACVTTSDCAAGYECGPSGLCARVAGADGGSVDSGIAGAGGQPGVRTDAGTGGAATRMDAGRGATAGSGGKPGTTPDGGVPADAGSPVKSKKVAASQGSCGCRAAGSRRESRSSWALLAGILLASRRRFRGRTRSRQNLVKVLAAAGAVACGSHSGSGTPPFGGAAGAGNESAIGSPGEGGLPSNGVSGSSGSTSLGGAGTGSSAAIGLGGFGGTGGVPNLGSGGTPGASGGGATVDASSAASGGGMAGAAGAGGGGDSGSKKPFKGVANSPCAAREALKVSWYYNWTQTETEPCENDDGGEFVPMIWGHTGSEQSSMGISSAISGFVGKGYRYVLGFNEPDNGSQSNISVATAVSLLPAFDNPAILVGTPATQANSSGQTWFKSYMADVAMTPTLRADFIGIHWYGWNAGSCDASASQLESYIKYAEGFPGNRPIWITEWGCLNDSAPTEAGVVAFYAGALAVFARHPRVERYSWYPWSTNCELNNSDGSLTSLGVAYAAAPAYR